jgi:hypothetical protein
MMTLNDLMNSVLWNLQQSELVNFGGAPSYASAVNPAIDQNALIFQINRAYQRVFVDLSDCEIELAHFQFKSVANCSDYTLPPGAGGQADSAVNYYNIGQPLADVGTTTPPHASVQRIGRILYHPHGQIWTMDFAGGIRLCSWRQFMSYCAFGYLRPFTFNIIPDYATVTPNRKVLSFFPGSANEGDTITVEYVPYLTTGTTWPPLTGGDDTPTLPDEAENMVIFWATALCWPKLREMQAAQDYEQKYMAESLRVREQLGPRSRGDTFRIRDTDMGLAESYPIGGALALP